MSGGRYLRITLPLIRPTAPATPRSLARRRKHIAGAGKSAAGGAERPADDRTDRTAGCSAPRVPGRLPGHRAGYRVAIPQMPLRLADAVMIPIARRTGIFRHRRAR